MKNSPKKKRTLRQRLPEILFGLVFLLGFGIFIYPTASEQWNKYRQSQLITDYSNVVDTMKNGKLQEAWKAARRYNKNLIYNPFAEDAFGEGREEIEDEGYRKVLNTGGDGIMGYISIPEIKQEIPIYHGTSEEVLQKGVGHLYGTDLPIGQKTSHCVLAAHRGLPSARLFSDIDKLKAGDKFYLHILDRVLAYQVDQIYPMIDKEDHEALAQAMTQQEGQDRVTLFTCTPYGVNSHRLLVQGQRTAYHGEEEKQDTTIVETMLRAVEEYYMLYVFLGIAVTLCVILLIKACGKMRRRGNAKEEKKE